MKISKGLQEEKDFKILKPIEGNVNEDGSFLCGREKGFEHKEFKFPDDYECDGCTLQFTWSTPYGDLYSLLHSVKKHHLYIQEDILWDISYQEKV